MAWNEPGGGSKDPWGGRGGASGPPDLDEMLRRFQKKLSALFGGGKGGGAPGGVNARSASLIGGVVLVVWLLSGIYIIDPAERGVEVRFGEYTVTTLPGPHWHWPYPIERVEVVNVDQIKRVEIGMRGGTDGGNSGSLILTRDENIVDLKLAVQYKIKDATAYLFNVRDPDATLLRVTESAVREIVGKSNMDLVIAEGRKEIEPQLEMLMQDILDRYGTGLQVTSVNMQQATAPAEVRDAFLDVVRSREDEQRLINEAHTYANGIVPVARGSASRQLQEAEAYKSQVIAQATGEGSRFMQVLGEYRKAPAVTRERLYLEAVESVLASAGKVMVDVKGSGNLLYLPLDRLGGAPADKTLEQLLPPAAAQTPIQEGRDAAAQPSDPRERTRERGGR
jgi:membrane protease subunit HflK